MDSINTIRLIRQKFHRQISDLTHTQLNSIPEGFNNSIMWNYGHSIITMQLLCYKLSGVEPRVSQGLIDTYRKGTKPQEDVLESELQQLHQLSIETVDQLSSDLEDELFEKYHRYETSFGAVLETVEDAISFNATHEAMHLGTVMAMRKLV